MKKGFLVCLILLILLAGCSPDPARPVVPETVPPVQTTVPEETQTFPTPAATEPAPEPTLPPPVPPEEFVLVAEYIPSILVELKYATEDNFTAQVIYDFTDAALRFGTVEKLALVQADLQQLGLGLKIWDAFRPVSAQFALWEAYPDSAYVADPRSGYSAHSRGNTLDVTLVDSQGREVPMPTGFDDFTAKADRDYSDCSEAAADNALILEILMEKHGFKGYKNEWWHFTDTDSYPVEESFQP